MIIPIFLIQLYWICLHLKRKLILFTLTYRWKFTLSIYFGIVKKVCSIQRYLILRKIFNPMFLILVEKDYNILVPIKISIHVCLGWNPMILALSSDSNVTISTEDLSKTKSSLIQSTDVAEKNIQSLKALGNWKTMFFKKLTDSVICAQCKFLFKNLYQVRRYLICSNQVW